MQQLTQATVNGLSLEEWSLGFVELLGAMEVQTNINSQLDELAPKVGSKDNILWHAHPGSCYLLFQEIESKYTPVVWPVLDLEVYTMLSTSKALQVSILSKSELECLGNPEFLEGYIHERVVIAPSSDTECSIVYENQPTITYDSVCTSWVSPVSTRTLFHNYQRLVAHYVHLNEYKLKTTPVNL